MLKQYIEAAVEAALSETTPRRKFERSDVVLLIGAGTTLHEHELLDLSASYQVMRVDNEDYDFAFAYAFTASEETKKIVRSCREWCQLHSIE